MIKVKLRKRVDKFYPYSIAIMGQESVLLKEKEFLDLYEQMTEIIIDNEELWEK